MPTRRYKLSNKNPYKISKYKALELRYFCLQYPEWKKEYAEISLGPGAITYDQMRVQNSPKNMVEEKAIKLKKLSDKIKLVEETVHLTNPEIEKWLLEGVTKDTTYKHLYFAEGIPCCERQYYNMKRKFYWLLSKER